MYSKDEIKKARKQVKKKKEFYQHLMTYVTTMAFLIAVNLLTPTDHIWFVYPMMGWGMAIIFHYVDVFGVPGFGMLDKNWEEQELENELRRMRGDDLPRLPEADQDGLKLKELRKNYDESELV